jgi:hypothetical protein
MLSLLDLDRQVIVAARTEETSLDRVSTMLTSNRSPQLQHWRAPVHRCYTARDYHLYRVHVYSSQAESQPNRRRVSPKCSDPDSRNDAIQHICGRTEAVDSAVSRSVEQASLSRDNQDLEKVRVLVPKCFTSCDF